MPKAFPDRISRFWLALSVTRANSFGLTLIDNTTSLQPTHSTGGACKSLQKFRILVFLETSKPELATHRL